MIDISWQLAIQNTQSHQHIAVILGCLAGFDWVVKDPKRQLKQEVQTALLDQMEVNKYPDGAVDEQVKQANDYYTQIAQMYGVELNDFITTYLNMTEDKFNEKIEESAKQAVQLEEAVKLIAKKEKLEPSDKEYEEGMQEYADKAGADLDTYKEQVGEDVLKDAILRDKVLDYLVDNCVQVEQSDKN